MNGASRAETVSVYVSIGSNIDRARRVRCALGAIRRRFGALQVSSVYETEAVGFVGDPFYNLVARFETSLSLHETVQALRDIERAGGRVRKQVRYAPRTLDIDLLLYGELIHSSAKLRVPRCELLTRAFVLRPLAEIAGDRLHPEIGRSFAELWSEFDDSAQRSWIVDLDLGGCRRGQPAQ